jgi:hypothetical protein
VGAFEKQGGKKMKPEDKLVDETEASELLKLSIQTLRNHRHLRRGCPYVKIGRSVRYLISDIKEYLFKNRIDPEAKV